MDLLLKNSYVGTAVEEEGRSKPADKRDSGEQRGRDSTVAGSFQCPWLDPIQINGNIPVQLLYF